MSDSINFNIDTADTAVIGYEAWVVKCPKHGEHTHSIVSNIKGHEGVWCQICWTESLGEPLPSERKSIPWENNHV
jgi:hypothetical protein